MDIRKISILSATAVFALAVYCGQPGYYGSSAPVGQVAPAGGIYCATPLKTCLLKEEGWLGTGCSCRIPGGYARGTVE